MGIYYPGLALPVLVNQTDGAEEEFIVVQLVCWTLIVKGKLHLPFTLLIVPAGTLVTPPLCPPKKNPNRAGQIQTGLVKRMIWEKK